MKITIYLSLFFLTCTLYTSGQEIFDVTKIAPELVKNANAVIRSEEVSFTARNQTSATLSYKIAVTILSKGGEDNAAMSEYYDKSSSIYNLKAVMYDAQGKKIKTYKSADFKDESITADGTMYDDYRVKRLVFLNSIYPYTVEYSYDKDYDGYLGYHSWMPVSAYNLSVEKSSYTLQLPQHTAFRYLKGPGVKTDSTLVNDKMIYKWACQSFPAIEYEPYSTGISSVTPWVRSTPNQFEYEHTKGSVATWSDLGSWIYQLSGDVQTLPETTKATVKTLISGAKNDHERIAILYKYLQSNTRYVSVQLGIGGFKPINALKVATVNYGDCKALSNYMKALLSEAGISSNLVMLGSDMPSLNTKFASFGQANHMILCVPGVKDTTWLECTSQYKPAGFLGNSTAAKMVLLVTPEGGKLVKTPVYLPEDNYQNRVTAVELSPEGNAKVEIKTDYGSCQYEDNLSMMLSEPIEQRKRLLNTLGVPNMELLSVSYSQPDKDLPKLHENIRLQSTQMLSQGGDKLFLTLNLLNRRESIPIKVENRKTAFALPYGYKDVDEVTYTLPPGYKAEFVPPAVSVESEFGRYSATAIVKNNTIIYTRSQLINRKVFPAEKYKDLIAFYRKIYLADKQKAVLAKVN